MIFILFFVKIFIAILAITFIFGNGEIKNGLISTAILFILSIIFTLIGLGGLFGTIFLVAAAYVLFLTIFKMETSSANASAAGFFAFMFLLSLIGL